MAGHSIVNSRNGARAQLGVCPQVHTIDEHLTGMSQILDVHSVTRLTECSQPTSMGVWSTQRCTS